MLPSSALAQVNFSPPTQGTLAPQLGDFRRLESTVSGTVSITIDAGYTGILQVFPPTFVSGPSTDPGGTTFSAIATFNTITLNSDGSTAALPTGVTPVAVSMAIQRSDFYPPGTYQYQVVLSVTAVPD